MAVLTLFRPLQEEGLAMLFSRNLPSCLEEHAPTSVYIVSANLSSFPALDTDLRAPLVLADRALKSYNGFTVFIMI
ncbi:hypothetical protein TNCV_981431 [Trichonephila clavipes]|uniref:Uncharacterized protein n=1 Tax=Trichonephila clavipes TaxID=2585209 RepID=A0A8X6S9X1_TRICX|nr:hypothetical protein TNCV_981431 [Trichonephila clavipes]